MSLFSGCIKFDKSIPTPTIATNNSIVAVPRDPIDGHWEAKAEIFESTKIKINSELKRASEVYPNKLPVCSFSDEEANENTEIIKMLHLVFSVPNAYGFTYYKKLENAEYCIMGGEKNDEDPLLLEKTLIEKQYKLVSHINEKDVTFLLDQVNENRLNIYLKYLGNNHFSSVIQGDEEGIDPDLINWDELKYTPSKSLQFSLDEIEQMEECPEDTEEISNISMTLQMSFSINLNVQFVIVTNNHPTLEQCLIMNETEKFSFDANSLKLLIEREEEGEVEVLSDRKIIVGEEGSLYNLIKLNAE